MKFVFNKMTQPSSDTIDTFIQLIREIWQDMPEKDWFSMDPEEEIRGRFPRGEAWLYTVSEAGNRNEARNRDEEAKRNEAGNGNLAGIFMATFPGLTEENLGWDLGFDEEALLKTAHMDTAVILPAYRGNGLQGQLMQKAEADLKQAGYRYLLCTIHPDNQYSMNNALKLGYKVAKSTVKYGGLPRNILLKTLF